MLSSNLPRMSSPSKSRANVAQRRRDRMERLAEPDPFCLQHLPPHSSPLRLCATFTDDSSFLETYARPRSRFDYETLRSESECSQYSEASGDDLLAYLERLGQDFEASGASVMTGGRRETSLADDDEDHDVWDEDVVVPNNSESVFELAGLLEDEYSAEDRDPGGSSDSSSEELPEPGPLNDVDPNNPLDIINYILEGTRIDDDMDSPSLATYISQYSMNDFGEVAPDWYLTAEGDIHPSLLTVIETLKSLRAPPRPSSRRGDRVARSAKITDDLSGDVDVLPSGTALTESPEACRVHPSDSDRATSPHRLISSPEGSPTKRIAFVRRIPRGSFGSPGRLLMNDELE